MPNEIMQDILKKYPWIKDEKQKLIISPDSDGFLSALLLMNYFQAEVVGYYDCKVMLCDANTDPRDCVFVDLDIFCRDIRSVGHHMVCYNRDRRPGNWYHYGQCIQPNILRDFDCVHSFQRKYPFATIHFLLSLLETVKPIEIAPDAIVPLLFSDGVCNNLFGYPENCLEWLRWLRADEPGALLHNVFYREMPFSRVMEQMDSFFAARDLFNAVEFYDYNERSVRKKQRSRSGHHMILSFPDGTPANIVENRSGVYDIYEKERERTLGFIDLLADLMGWRALPDKWAFSKLELYKFKKEILGNSPTQRLNLANYIALAERDCFSMAITSKATIEYTRDTEGYFRK